MTLSIIIVDKVGTLKPLNVKTFNKDELYKKCGFKKDTNFSLKYTLNMKLNDKNYYFSFYGKSDGKNNFENKFPILSVLNIKIYGNFAIVGYDENQLPINLTMDMWNCISEQLCNRNYDVQNFQFHTIKQNDKKTTTTTSTTLTSISTNDNLSIIENDVELVEDEYNYSSDEDC